MRASIVVVLLLAGSVARADDEAVNPETAQRLSVIGSAVPLAAIGLGAGLELVHGGTAVNDLSTGLLVGGLLVGVITPSLGHFYAHHWLDGAIAMRGAGVLIGFVGLVSGFNNDVGDCATPGPCHHSATTYGLLIGGAALYLGGMALDLVGAPETARAWNARHQLQLSPTAMRSGHSTVAGVGVALRW
jgi:hypothetical protein